MKKYLLFLFIINILCLNLLQAQTTNIPDANFEQALIDLGIDTDGLNGQVLTSDINTLTDLYIIDKNILIVSKQLSQFYEISKVCIYQARCK